VRRLAAALVLLLAAPATARAAETDVGIGFSAFGPTPVTVLTGDTVRWTNVSVRVHTVNALDGGWSSPEIVSSDYFVHRFDTPGTVAYYCRIHPFMTGLVDVANVLIDPPAAPGADGRPYTFRGRSADGPQAPVTIQADRGSGFRDVATATVNGDGTFAASVTPDGTASYRAVAGADASPPVTLTVLDRTVRVHARRHGRRVAVAADVSPATPGGTVVLQAHLRERFGWWPLRSTRLNRRSHARFVITMPKGHALRVVLTLRDRATPLAISPVLRVGALHRRNRRG
jgi:plastocyanin